MLVKPKVDVIKKYNLPLEVKYCKRCVISNQRPRIRLDEEGVCSACRFAEKKQRLINWEEREKELIKLLDKHRRKDGYWDVVVPSSGGKDSFLVAHMLKYKYNMKPLTATWAPHIYTDVGWRNLQHMINSGLDNVLGTPNGKVHRILTKLSLEKLGDVFQPFIYGQKAFPMQVAVKYKIPLVMFGENGEVEYGGDDKNEDRPTHNVTDDMVKHYFSGFSPEDWVKCGVNRSDLQYYFPPAEEEAKSVGLENHFFSYYRKWVPQENYYYAVEHGGLEPEPDGRSEGTYSKYASLDDKLAGFHSYFAFIKFGIGRCTSDAAHEVRDGHITREEAVALVRRFDGEFPKKHFKAFLEYVDMKESDFWEIVDSFRAEHLWGKVNGEWKLKYQVS
ncbi:MAG: N-acetyl sugar amidotransferase [Candidatus Omnitrophota bacterium]